MKVVRDDEYERAQQVWNTIEKKTLGCYHNLFLKTDIIETFQNACLGHYKLNPAHFYFAPRLAWQALLKTVSDYCQHQAKCKGCDLCLGEFRLELLTDIDMLLMFEKGMQDVITQVVKRYGKANNKYMKDQCSPDETNTHLQFLHANNFYEWAMIQKLPMLGFS